MNLAHILQPHCIRIGVPVTTKEQAIKYLVDIVAHDYTIPDAGLLYTSVLDRESISSTTMENGISMPHTRIENFNDLSVSVLIPETPITDGDREIRILFLIITDLTKSNLYLNVMAGIVSLSQNQELMNMIIGANSPKDFMKIIESGGISIGKVIFVKDIMNTTYRSLPPSATLKNALDFIVKNQKPYIPVCDENGVLIGEVIMTDILTIGMPHYAQMLKNLAFLSTIEPLDELLRYETDIEIRTIMRKPSIVLSPGTSIVEALFHFIRYSGCSFLPVTENMIFQGVLSHMDLVNNFLRA